jgi:hypothetical protein
VIALNSKQVVSLEELLMSPGVQQEVLARFLLEKGIFTQKESLEMARAVDREKKRGWPGLILEGFAE